MAEILPPGLEGTTQQSFSRVLEFSVTITSVTYLPIALGTQGSRLV